MSIAAIALLLASAVHAQVTLPAVFSDHMVLQREIAAPVWGWAKPGETVRVTIAGQSKETTADTTGKWMVKLDPLQAGGPHEMVVAGTTTIAIKDILVGDVWVCSGQSNMERQLGPRGGQDLNLNWEQEAATARFPQIRHFCIAQKLGKRPLPDVTGSWVVCSPETVKDFTAVGYFFARDLVQDLKIPIGLLHSSLGGTKVAQWTSKQALLADFPEVTATVEEALRTPDKELWGKRMETPTILFDRMLAPLIPFGIKGALWYQGESGAGLDLPYGKVFQAMIRDWRKQWQLGDFPFYFVQVGNWATCEGQASALRLPNTGMAVINDISNTTHPLNKVPIGQRLARLALVQTYGRKGESTGPLFESAKVEGNSIRIRFTHAGDGLVVRDGPPMKYFIIAGDDKRFLVADVRIDGDTVVISNPKVPQPLAVRYAWTGSSYLNFKESILLNKAGFPAAPFRTDNWPIEEKKKAKE